MFDHLQPNAVLGGCGGDVLSGVALVDIGQLHGSSIVNSNACKDPLYGE